MWDVLPLLAFTTLFHQRVQVNEFNEFFLS